MWKSGNRFFRTLQKESGILVADIVRNEFYIFCFFVEKEEEPGTCLKIFSAAVEVKGIAADLHIAGFCAFSPVHVADDIACLIRKIRKVQCIQNGGIVLAEFDRRFFPAELDGITDWNDAEIVSDLIVAAFNDAKSKLEEKISETAGGFLPGGMKLPF